MRVSFVIAVVATISVPSTTRAQEILPTDPCTYIVDRIRELDHAGEDVTKVRQLFFMCIAALRDQQTSAAQGPIKRYNDALDRRKGDKI